MYNDKLNGHCGECICPTCDLFQTDKCFEGEHLCDKCDSTVFYTGKCFWHPSEQKLEGVKGNAGI